MINKMKRVNSFLIAAFVAASALMVASCSDDDEVDDPAIAVKVTYSSAPTITETISANAVVTKDEGIGVKFDINFKQGTNKMSDIHISTTIDGIGTYAVWDTTGMEGGPLNFKGGKEFDKTISTTVGKATETFKFEMVDKRGNPSSFTLTVKPTEVTTPPAPGSYNTSSVKLYGQGSNLGGSFYAYKMGRDIKISEANSQKGSIDFIFYNGSGTGETGLVISSPDKATAFSAWGKNGANENSTKFQKVTGASPSKENADSWWDEWDAYSSDLDLDKAIDLKVGEAYFFKNTTKPANTGSKKLAFIVKSVTAGNAGTVELTIIEKVE